MSIVTQTLVTGLLLAGLYSIFALGLSLSWGILHTINFAHFSFAFLSAYVTYQVTTTLGWDPLLTLAVTIPLGIILGILLQVFVSVFRIDVFGSLIVTFALFLIFEAMMSMAWTADLRRIPLEANHWFIESYDLGPVTVPFVGLLSVGAAAMACGGVWWLLNRTHVGTGIRAFVQDPEMAEVFGVNHGRLALLVSAIAGGTAGATGTIIGMQTALTPSSPEIWIGVIFAVVLLGGLANPAGVVGAALLVSIIESLTRQFADPAMARLTALVVLAIALVVRPEGLFKPIVGEARE